RAGRVPRGESHLRVLQYARADRLLSCRRSDPQRTWRAASLRLSVARSRRVRSPHAGRDALRAGARRGREADIMKPLSRIARRPRLCLMAVAAGVIAGACSRKPPADRVRVSGQVEATAVQIAPPVG